MIYKGEKDIISLFPTVLPAGKSSTANPKEAELLLVAFFQAQLCIIYLINNFFKFFFSNFSNKIFLFCLRFCIIFCCGQFFTGLDLAEKSCQELPTLFLNIEIEIVFSPALETGITT